MKETEHISVPLDKDLQTYCVNDCERVDREEYQYIIGALT